MDAGVDSGAWLNRSVASGSETFCSVRAQNASEGLDGRQCQAIIRQSVADLAQFRFEFKQPQERVLRTPLHRAVDRRILAQNRTASRACRQRHGARPRPDPAGAHRQHLRGVLVPASPPGELTWERSSQLSGAAQSIGLGAWELHWAECFVNEAALPSFGRVGFHV